MYVSDSAELRLTHAKRLLKAWGVPEHLNGFCYIAEAAVIKSYAFSRRLYDVYSRIACSRGIAVKTVSNCVSYTLRRNRDAICAASNIPHDELYNSKFISSIALYINNSFLAPPPPRGREQITAATARRSYALLRVRHGRYLHAYRFTRITRYARAE